MCVQLTVVLERIMAFSLASPLAKFLNGLEILLSKAQVSSVSEEIQVPRFLCFQRVDVSLLQRRALCYHFCSLLFPSGLGE